MISSVEDSRNALAGSCVASADGADGGMDQEERAILRSTAERILEDTPAFRIESDDCPALDRDRWLALADAGLLGVSIDPSLGGSGLGLEALSIVGEAAGRLAPALPFLGAIALFAELVRLGGSDAQRGEWLPEVARGRLIGAFACAESGTSDWHHPTSRVESHRGGLRLRGRKTLVLGGPYAEKLIVSARGPDDRVLLVPIDADAAGVQRRDATTFDGTAVSEILFDDVRLPEDSVLGGRQNASELIERVVDGAIALLCAEGATIAGMLCEKTKDYCRARIAFGAPLTSQQVLRHRLVDMFVASEHLTVLADRAKRSQFSDLGSRRRAVSAAKVALDQDGRFVAQSAVQLHGAVGITEELDVGRLFRRMTSLCHLLGTRDLHLARFWAHRRGHRASDRVEEVLGVLSAEERGFREEVRDFYGEKLTPELRRAGRLVRWTFSEFEYGRQWQRILHEKRWGAPHWPVRYGGCDWSARQHLIFAMETVAAQPPAITMMGRDLCAPCIMEFGTEAQKAEFLPRILDGSDWWAQGYSEPQAGSDLASLQLRADDGGSCYILNGSKIWTTFAHNANRIFCLVRTSRGVHPQEGISFLLVDMDLPGIDVRPIRGIGGEHEFNQVFFTDVRVPKARLLGQEGAGWNIARYLLRYEHGAQIAWPMKLREWTHQIEFLASRACGTVERLIDNPHFRSRLATAEVELEAVEALAVRIVKETLGGAPPGVYAEMVNLRLRALRQHLTELMMDAVGAAALLHRQSLLQVATSAGATEEALAEALAVPLYFSQRGASIAGGTPEIHRNNIARKILDT